MKRQLLFRDADNYGANLIRSINEFVRIIFSANLYPKNSPIVNIICFKGDAIR